MADMVAPHKPCRGNDGIAREKIPIFAEPRNPRNSLMIIARSHAFTVSLEVLVLGESLERRDCESGVAAVPGGQLGRRCFAGWCSADPASRL